ncbi:MAG: sugar transferase [Verrucomicrobiae bacterium]|nr:sugar transferase [Verrucomicrobiae bacterium]
MNATGTIALPRWKRLLDCTLIVLSIPFLVPLALVIVFIIKRKSAGPVLFQQKRLGYHGAPFMCLKFRTMHCGAETVSHQGHLQQLITSDAPMTKLDNSGDSRIIPLGKILRSSGLDELPQLINVLKGEMSLVGPRPCVPYEAEKYLPWQKERFDAAPGLTGLWQVSGKNRTTFTRMMQLDIEYARTKSLWLDGKIIFLTVPALLVQIWDSRQKKKAPNCVGPAQAAMTVRVTHN